MLQGKKAVVKVSLIALLVFSVVAAVTLVAPTTGEEAITGDVVAEGDIGIQVHEPSMALSPDIANCDDIPTTFTVNIENGGGYDIYNVKINKALTNIVTLTCGSAPVGWDFLGFKFGTYCEYETDPYGDDVIELGDNLNFTFDATLKNDDDCMTTFRITTLDNEAIITGTGNGSEINTFLDLKVDCEAPITIKTLGWPKKEDGNLEWINSITNITLEAVDMSEECEVGVNRTYYKNILAADILKDILNGKFYSDWNCVEGNCEEEPCRDIDLCENLAGYLDYDYGNWSIYHEPFSKHDEPQSCHILYYYSKDNLGNKEDIKTNCFFVDKSAPVPEKIVGEPSIPIPEDIEELGNGHAEWSTEESYSGSYSVKLVIPDNAVGTDFAGVDSFFDVFVELDDVTNLSYYRKVTQFDKGWSPIVILGIDADGDGVFEAQPLEWEASWDGTSFNPTFLGDDSFIQCESKTGLSGTDGSFIQVDAYNNFACYTPNVAGDNYNWDVYQPLDYFKSNNVGRVESTDKVAMVKIELGGNPSTQDNEIAYVDSVELNGKIIIDEPTWWWVRDHFTPITLNCTDPEPHPSGDEEVCYKVSFGDPQNPDLTQQYCGDKSLENGWCCVPSPKQIIFQEDSLHDLEYFCRDAVNKTSEIDKEWFIVDSQPPIITKTMIGDDHLGVCPPKQEGDVCYVKDSEQNGVRIDVRDDLTYGHAVGGVTCSYELWWEEQQIDSGSFDEEGKSIIFREDSTHTLKINCEDALGNSVEDVEEFLVDSMPPTTIKTLGEPKKVIRRGEGENDLIEWITSQTPITLNAIDEKVGVEETWYMNILAEDAVIVFNLEVDPERPCREPDFCDIVLAKIKNNLDHPSLIEKWLLYEGPFRKEEESCHVLVYYSEDKLGNEEDMKVNCFFVDNTPPVTEKWHEGPIEEGWNETIGEFHYVTTDTSIFLDCKDQQPHPVDQETLYWRFSWWENGFEGEPEYSDWYSKDYEGFPVEIYFEEDSWHDLEYYCVDHLGNKEETHTQYYAVDTQPPIINKTIVGPSYGDCPPKRQGDVCYIDGVTEIHVDAVDPEPHPVDNVWCEWEYYYDGYLYDGGEFGEEGTVITFKEDSEHILYIKCWDALENYVEDTERFLVDHIPPETIKWYEGPQYGERYPKWITSDTLVFLEADDEKSGVAATYWRNTLLENDEYCWSQELCVEEAEGSGNWNLYEGPFTKDEESCHLIEYYSVDNVNKTETTKKQCVFVDNSPPTPVKEVGEPKTDWDGKDSLFYPWIEDYCWNGQGDQIDCWKVTLDTPISMTCTDPQPHPVDNEKICFNVELDGDDYTDNEEYSYCDEYDGEMEGDYCCLDKTIEEFYFLESSEHNLKFYCEDALGNRGDIDEEKFKVEGNDFIIELNKKWNLISVPVVLLNDDPEEVFKNMSCVDSIWAYDPEEEMCESDGEGWCVYTVDEGPDNLRIIPGFGYWVLAKEECENPELIIGGSLLSPRRTPPSRTLISGWNLIGYYGMENSEGKFIERYYGPEDSEGGMDAYCALYSLTSGELGLPKWSSLYGYWELDNPQFEGYNMFAQLDPGAGYWINLKDNQQEYIYSPSTVCYDWWGGWF